MPNIPKLPKSLFGIGQLGVFGYATPKHTRTHAHITRKAKSMISFPQSNDNGVKIPDINKMFVHIIPCTYKNG